MKEIYLKIKKKIDKSNLIKLFKSKEEIRKLENKIGDLENETRELIDNNRTLKAEVKKLQNNNKKASDYKKDIKLLNRLLENSQHQVDELTEEKKEFEIKMFNLASEVSMYKIQCEEYEAQIEDLKSERYLVKKIPSGRTPNTIKTKISKPLSGNVTKSMRGEHE